MSDIARLEAYKSFKRISEGAFSNLLLNGSKLSGIDRAFAESIVLGTLERRITLEFVLSKFIKTEAKPDLKTLLLTAVYQILYMDRVPDSAVCDETVKLAKELFGQKYTGFVNAVLRNICRSKAETEKDIENAEEYIKYSADRELYGLLKKQYPKQSDAIFSSLFGKRRTFLRVNTLLSDAREVAELTDGEIIGEGCVVTDNASLAARNSASGKFFIQGRASQKASELLKALPGQTVVDVCACPGGKSLGAAIDMKNSGKIYSFDLHKSKLPLITKSAKTLGITIIEPSVQDAKNAKSELIGKADRVICDVPCSGTGVMGSKPEIKYKSPDGFKGLYPTQRAIISAASKYLKRGGVMVYSTCSINKKENEEIVRGFIDANKDFKLAYEKTCLPFEEEGEGFYMAELIRE